MIRTKKRLRALGARRARPHRPRVAPLEGRVLLSGVDVTQYHNDTYLSGANLDETTLTPSNVNPTDFGLLFSHAVDGYVYAEPLYMSGLTIDGAVHNVAFVATENDTVYAFDADSNTGADAQPLWVHSFADPADGITAIPQPDVISHDIYPVIGITGTPVIDPSTNTLYVVTNTEQIINGDTSHPNYIQTLHALNVTTGQETVPGGYVIGDTVYNPDGSYVNNTAIQTAGTGDDSVNGIVTFNALRENQRPALQIDGNWILVGWASHGDYTPYHGWLVAFDRTTLQPDAWFNTDPNGSESGIWQSGDPPAIDPATGAIYFATGNGTFDEYGPTPDNDYGESVIRLNPTPVATPQGNQFTVQDFFTPYEFQTLNDNDADLGSGGTMLLPDFVGSAEHPHLMVETGKSGKIYLIDRDDMGKIQNPGTGPDGNVQTVTAGQAGVWGSPTFLQVNSTTGIIYYHGSGDVLKGYYVTNGHIEDGSEPGDLPILYGNYVAGYPGAQPVISANGTVDPTSPTDAIVWELQIDQYGTSGPSILRAYDALDPSDELYDSTMTGARDTLGGAVKFTVPTVADGHVYVGSEYSFSVFGLFPAATAIPATPTDLTATTILGAGSQIQLSWTNPAPASGAAATGIEVLRSTDGVNFTQVTTVSAEATSFTDPGPFSLGQPYTYELVAVNQAGSSAPSAPAQVNVTIEAPVLSITNDSATTISLSWSGVANDHYVIERSSDGVHFAAIATVPASQLTYTDTGLAPGIYTYRLEAFNVNPVASSVSNVQGATVGPTVDESIGFDNTAALTANGSAQFAEATARITNANDQTGSVFTNNRFTIGSFSTSFTVRLHEGTQPYYADGITFVIQAGSPTALGQGFGGMGYQGIGNSIAIKLDPFQNPGDPSDSSTGLFENGAGPFGGVDTTANGGPLINSQDTKLVTLTYDGTTLTETITNTLDLSQVFTISYQVDIPAVIGSDTAYVGFTGSTGDNQFWELQDITGWTFTSTEPLPGAPTNLQATNPSPSEIDLTWASNSYNETGFAIERSTDGVNFTQIGTTTSTSYQDTGLITGTYYYRVYAYNTAGTSPYSNTLNFATGSLINYSSGFTNHANLSANGTVDWNAPVLQLTNGDYSEAGSSFYTTPVSILNFSTTFTFQMLPGYSPPPIADGFTFTIQDDPNGTAALGSSGGGLGFGTDYGGPIITNSVAIKFDAYKPGGNHSSTGVYVDGDLPAAGVSGPGDAYVPLDDTGIDFNAAATAAIPHTFQATLSYDGTTLTETIADETTGATFTTSYTINIATFLGSTQGYVGFTGGTGGSTSIQDIDTWTGSFLTEPPPLPAPWQDEDIGGPSIAGSAVDSSGTFTINASGDDIWGTADQFHFVSQEHTGDLVAVADVTSQDYSDPWAKAGVMVRDGLDADASYALIAVTPGNGVVFQYRDGTGTEAQWNGQLGGSAPEWVMMVRTGSTFSGFASTDGLNWTFVGSASIYMSDPVQVGLADDAHNDGILGNATFDNVSVASLQLPPSFSDTDIGGPGLVGSAIFNPSNGTWTVNGGGADIWNATDQFNYASELFDGDGTLVAQVEGLNYTDPWAKAGVMFRDSLDAGSVFADMVVTPGNGVALQWRDQYGNLGNEQITGIVAPEWVELVRQGDEFSGYYSTDGVNWYSVGAPVSLNMTTDALAGLAVTAHNDGDLTSATFTNFSATPAGWSDQDIGSPGLPGGATFDGATWTVLGGGSDIWNDTDQFNFVSQSFTGDGAIAADVDSLTDTDPWAKAGVMFRDSLDAGAVFADVVVTPGQGVAFQWRDQNGNLGSDQITGVTAPIHVMLARSGDVFTGYYSTDGVSWVEIGSQALDMNATALVGLAVTAHNNGLLNDATFTEVSVAPLPTLSGVSFTGPGIRNQPVSSIDVTFDEPIDPSTLPAAIGLTRNGVSVAIPAGTLAATLVPGTTATYLVSGLGSLTGPDGLYVLSVDATQVLDAQDVAPGEGTASSSWLMDTTPPMSTVSPLPKVGSSLNFTVTVTGTDPSGPGGSPASGIASFAVYVSTNGGAWTFWTALTPAAQVPNTASATFTGTSNTVYAFYSTATDNAGNVQPYKPVIEASTDLPNLNPPVTQVASSSTYNTNGTFTLNLTGTDTGGNGLAYFEVYVAIDAQPPVRVGAAIPSGSADNAGTYHATVSYGIPLSDYSATHSYRFYSQGIDAAGLQEAAHAAPNDVSFSESYVQPVASQVAVTGLTVENGAAERSYIRYLDLDFNDSNSTVLQSIVNSVNSNPNFSSAQELQLFQYGLDGKSNKTPVSIQDMLSVVDNAIAIDFGSGGIGGHPGTTAADGYYVLSFVPPSGQGQTATHSFYRLLGDANGDGVVDQNDLNEIAAARGQSVSQIATAINQPASGLTPLSMDVNGDGSVNTTDLALATKSKGRSLAKGLPLG